MRVGHNRLLILLVLVSVVAAASWSTVFADRATGPPTVAPASVALSKPAVVPTSGEPDVGQTPHPVSHAGVGRPGPRGDGEQSPRQPVRTWLDWIIRTWMMRYFGSS